MAKRIDEINIIKGIGILMVVCIHFLSISGLKQFCGVGIKIEMSLAAPLMVLFFILSGYLSSDRKASGGSYLAARMKRIFVPYYRMAALLLVIYAVIYLAIEGRSFRWYLDGAVGMLLQLQAFHGFDPTATGLHPMYYGVIVGWFIFQMAAAEVIFVPLLYFLKDKDRRWKLVSAAVCLALGALFYSLDLQGLNEYKFTPLLIGLVIPNIPGIVGLMMVGEYLAAISYLDFDSYSRKRMIIEAVLSIAVIIVLMATDNYTYRFPYGEWGAWGALSYLTETIYGLAIITILGIISHGIKKCAPVKETLGYIGTISMSILVVHYFLAYLTAYVCGFWQEPMAGPVSAPNAAVAAGRFLLLAAVNVAIFAIFKIVKTARIRKAGE